MGKTSLKKIKRREALVASGQKATNHRNTNKAANQANALLAMQEETKANAAGALRRKSLLSHYQKQSFNALAEQINQADFLWIGDKSKKTLMLYERASGLLWDANPNLENRYYYHNASPAANALTVAGLKNWQIPTTEQIIQFSSNNKNPLREGSNCHLFDDYYWATTTTGIDLDNYKTNSDWTCRLIACHKLLKNKSAEQVIVEITNRGWKLYDVALNDLFSFLNKTPSLVKACSEIDTNHRNTNKAAAQANALLAMQEETKAAEVKKALLEVKIARHGQLQKTLDVLLANNMGDWCNEYLRQLATTAVQVRTLSNLATMQAELLKKSSNV